DPDNGYFPSPGRISLLLDPSGPGIRLDSGVYEGWTVPVEYDPLLAKLIGYGADRKQAISRLTRAVTECWVGGIKTNLAPFRRILKDADFRASKFDTGYLERLGQPGGAQDDVEIAIIAAGIFAALDSAGSDAAAVADTNGNKAASSGWKHAAR